MWFTVGRKRQILNILAEDFGALVSICPVQAWVVMSLWLCGQLDSLAVGGAWQKEGPVQCGVLGRDLAAQL